MDVPSVIVTTSPHARSSPRRTQMSVSVQAQTQRGLISVRWILLLAVGVLVVSSLFTGMKVSQQTRWEPSGVVSTVPMPMLQNSTTNPHSAAASIPRANTVHDDDDMDIVIPGAGASTASKGVKHSLLGRQRQHKQQVNPSSTSTNSKLQPAHPRHRLGFHKQQQQQQTNPLSIKQRFENWLHRGHATRLSLIPSTSSASTTTTRQNQVQRHYQKTAMARNEQGAKRPTIRLKKKYPKVIYFVHIHKSAGSLFCDIAYRNKVNCNKKENCNVQTDQYCCGNKDTMEAQIQFANTTYWDMVAIERDMYEHMAPSHYDYVVSLRRAKDRYYSHWGHLRRIIPIGPGFQMDGLGDAAWLFANNTIQPQKEKKRLLAKGEDPLGSFQQWLLGQPDNWTTRILCGPKCRPQPKFQITRELFYYTLHRVEQFSYFLFVEDMEASYNIMAKSYQWKSFAEVTNHKFLAQNSNRRNDKVKADKKLQHESWDTQMSALDDALYEYAKRIYNHRNNNTNTNSTTTTHITTNSTTLHLWEEPFSNQDALERYFRDGPKANCTDICCGKCTPY